MALRHPRQQVLGKLGIALVLRGKTKLASKAAEVGRVEDCGERAQ